MKDLVQVALARKVSGGDEEMVCWLDADPRIRVGVDVSLEGDARRWTVAAVCARKPKAEVRTDWTVGGITSVAR